MFLPACVVCDMNYGYIDQYCFLILDSLLNYLMESKDKRACIIAFSIDIKGSQTIFTALFNNEAYHSPSLALAVLDNVLFMSLSGKNASLTISNKPQPRRSIINKEKRRYAILFIRTKFHILNNFSSLCDTCQY